MLSDSENRNPALNSVQGLRHAVKAISKEKKGIQFWQDLYHSHKWETCHSNKIFEYESKPFKQHLLVKKQARKGKPIVKYFW